MKLTALIISLSTSVIITTMILVFLDRWGVLEDPYFQFEDAKMLSTHLTSDQTLGLCFLFALNQFLAQVNHVLIEPIFGRQLINHIDEEGEDRELNVRDHPFVAGIIFMVYDVWKSSRSFLSILGIVSNFAFFVSTLIGGFLGALLVRPGFLIFRWTWMMPTAVEPAQGKQSESVALLKIRHI